MYFLFDENFMTGAVVQELQAPVHQHDSNGYRRRMCLIDLCYYTLLGHENIQNASELARLTNVKQTQAQIVWDILIKHGVLRKGAQGYSARPWMIERGILGDINKRRRQEQPQQPQQAQGQSPFIPGQYQTKTKNEF